MDKLALATVVIVAVLSCPYSVDALIGLKPAKKPPHREDPPQKPKHPVSPRPTQLHSPFDNPSELHNETLTDNLEDHDEESLAKNPVCHPVPLLRCSYRLVRQSLQNETSICVRVQGFNQCILDSLRKKGRKEFVTGLSMLEELNAVIYKSYGCQGNVTLPLPAHTRHNHAKRHESSCCTDGIINCTVQSFLKMTTNPTEQCNVVEFYDSCLKETSITCHLKSYSTSYPVFTSLLRRKCHNLKVRRKRDLIIQKLLYK